MGWRKPASLFYFCYFKQSFNKAVPSKEWAFIVPLHLCLWCAGLLGQTWAQEEVDKLAVNPCLNSTDVRCQRHSCYSSVAFVRSSTIITFSKQYMHIFPTPNEIREFSLLLNELGSEKARCSVLLESPVYLVCIQGGTLALWTLTLAPLKRRSGKALCPVGFRGSQSV